MKVFAAERKVLLEELYREAGEHFLEQRTKTRLTYLGAPKAPHGTQVYVMMADDLRHQVRAVVTKDHQGIANAFETALQLYLKHHGRPCPRPDD